MKPDKKKGKTSGTGKSGQKKISFRLVMVLLILIAAAVLVRMVQSGFNLDIKNPFVKREEISTSSLLLTQVRNISRLNTVEFIYKSVFPYDLIDADIDFEELQRRRENKKVLKPKEIEALAVYNIAKQAGIDLFKNHYSFAVIQARIKAGYNFPDPLPETMLSIDPETNTVSIKLPSIKITEVIIEDSDSTDYGYPDLEVNPEQWKALTSIMSTMVTDKARQRGILAEADKRGKEFIKNIIMAAGYQNVVFND